MAALLPGKTHTHTHITPNTVVVVILYNHGTFKGDHWVIQPSTFIRYIPIPHEMAHLVADCLELSSGSISLAIGDTFINDHGRDTPVTVALRSLALRIKTVQYDIITSATKKPCLYEI